MKIYIVSDFHLSFDPTTEEEKKRNALALDFLDSIKTKADLLILAGDIFELWYDWKSVILKGYFPFLKKLADLNENGCRLVFVAGNHDFWFGNFMPDYLDCELHMDYFKEKIDGKNIFVSHGDTYTINDTRYKIFRRIIRHPISRFLFSLMHPNLAMALGMKASRTSRATSQSTVKSANKRTNGLELHARKISNEYDIIVMGHSHQPTEKQIGNSLYLNAGYWGKDYKYVEIIDGIPKLLTFEKA